jgi:hypothetical protein
MKFKQFVKDNATPITIGGVLITGAIVTAVVIHHNHKKKEQAGQPQQLPAPQMKQLPAPQTMSGAKKNKKQKINPNILL